MTPDRLTLAEYAERRKTPYYTMWRRLRGAIHRGLDKELAYDEKDRLRRQYCSTWDQWLAPRPTGRPRKEVERG
jgi:hypothetical protein